MAGTKKKYYVVWSGRKPGIYETWDECRSRVEHQAGARYKSFASEKEAKQQLAAGAPPIERKPRGKKASSAQLPENPPEDRTDTLLHLPPKVKAQAWAVDAACSGNPGKMEYRGVDLRTGCEVFHFGPIMATNNIGEFLAIVHALALLEKMPEVNVIYSDSRNAQLWVKGKKCKTQLVQNHKTAKAHELIGRAEQWLQHHKYTTKIIKWETRQWGEIPADFGRK